MLLISESVDGASVAAARPNSARATISMVALVENAASTDAAPKATAPIIRRRRRPIRSPSVPMVMSAPADHEAVDIDDPQHLGRARPQADVDLRHGEVEDREVHGIEHAGQRDDGEPQPVLAGRLSGARKRWSMAFRLQTWGFP